ncbi:hypothetical protein GGR52DRAFT_166046 [Hypoxylon sp. FL1284]|nr:hypothetical protein GGR52DRAFT_166046 [Hypoxylon sp. FL1284]
MAMNLSASWTPPPPSILNLGNCAAITDFLADQFVIASLDEEEREVRRGDYGKITNFLTSMVPDDWSDERPSLDQLSLWWNDVWGNTTAPDDPEYIDIYREIYNQGIYGCNHEICDKLDIDGDPDVSGLGMMASYYLAAALATVYLFALSIGSLLAQPRRYRVVEAFGESANTFLDAALVFSGTMLVSATVRYTSFIRGHNDEEDYSYYRILAALSMSIFAITPCLVIQTVANKLRRRLLRQVLWLAVVGLFIAAAVQYFKVFDRRLFKELFPASGTYAIDTDGIQGWWKESLWLRSCSDDSVIQRLFTSWKISFGLLGINLVWLLYYVSSSIPLLRRFVGAKLDSVRMWKSHGTTLHARWTRLKPFLRFANGILCCAAMWLLLITFTLYRKSVQRLAPSTDKDSDWTFGQVLALATWVPVVVEWVAIMIYGPESGLEGHMSTEYQVTRTSSAISEAKSRLDDSNENLRCLSTQ